MHLLSQTSLGNGNDILTDDEKGAGTKRSTTTELGKCYKIICTCYRYMQQQKQLFITFINFLIPQLIYFLTKIKT